VPQYAAGTRARVLAVLERDLAIDDRDVLRPAVTGTDRP